MSAEKFRITGAEYFLATHQGQALKMKFIGHVKDLAKKYGADEMSVYAAQAAFFIFLSIFPFLMVFLALIQLFPPISEADFMVLIRRIVPDQFLAQVLSIINSLRTSTPEAVLSASAITAIWSSGRGVMSIERGLNRVYDVKTKRNYILRRIICAVYILIFLVACIATLTLLVFGGTIESSFVSYFPDLSWLVTITKPIRELLAPALLVIFFIAIYKALPHRKQKLRYTIPGALISAIGWTVFSMAFSVYFKYFGTFTVTYGSLTAVILIMLWLYICICMLFCGAEINRYIEDFQEEKKLKVS